MLIHFTPKVENLLSILNKKSLILRYCGEEFSNKRGSISSNAAHPMVSFSEYEEDTLQNANVTYGNFGIAFNKQWAKDNNINPVIYIDNLSFAASGLESLLKARRNANIKLPMAVRLAIIKIKCFTKNKIGYNSWNNDKEFEFYKENEWRFVPTKKQIGGNLISINYSAYNKNKEKYNNKIKSYPLTFDYKDIEFIYVDNKNMDLVRQKFPLLVSKIKLKEWK
jgi:hypothetical protein